MTNQQWPQQGQSPWAQQDPNWRPPQFQDATQRDPRKPFGQAPAEQPETSFEPPRNSRGTLVAVLAIGVLVAALIIGFQFLGSPSATESSSPAPQPSPTASRTGNWIPFEGNGDGIFEVTKSEWTEQGLEVTIRVEVTRGEFNFAIYAFINRTREGVNPTDTNQFTASVDKPYVGTFLFPGMPREDATLVLTTPSGNVLLNALPISS